MRMTLNSKILPRFPLARITPLQLTRVLSNLSVFVPGIILVNLAFAVLLAPNMVVTLISGFLLFVGIFSCFIGWKLLRVKRRLEKMAKEFEGRVLIQGINLRPQTFEEAPQESNKKILYH